jgi:microcystin-dependent protein
MANPFVAEIRIFAGNFAPTGWALCDGQLMPISQNTALFSLLGTTYGGDGKSNFALPNLRGMSPLQAGQGPGLSMWSLGETQGSDTVTLLNSEIPAHSHAPQAKVGAAGDTTSPDNAVWGKPQYFRQLLKAYSTAAGTLGNMNTGAVGGTGSSFPHNNLQPYLTLTFIIALQGVFPPRS